jgi:drug/metabolite transporter (DMT)-like permease
LNIRDRKDFWSGVMFVVFGVLFVVWSREYQFGTSQRMGPGYFPTVLGILLILLGLMVALPALKKTAPETDPGIIGWRGLLIVLGSVALYAFLLPRLGFVVSLIALIVISSVAHREYTWRAIILSVLVLGIGSYFVFVKGLELQFSVWPPFLTR